MSLTQAQIIELAKNQPSSGYSTQQIGDIAQTAQQTTTRADNPSAFAISPEMQAVVGAQSSGQLDTGNQQAVTDFVQNYRKSAAPPAPPPDPLLSLSPAQRAEFSKQFSIALSKGQVGDQSSVDAFKSSFVAGASGGGVPTLASTQPRSTISNSGASMTSQGNLSGANSTALGTTSRYGLGTSGMSPEEEELTRQLETVEKPKTAEEIAAERTQSAQAEINAINENYNNQLIEQSRVNDLRSAEANAQSVLSGLTGSTEAGTRAVNVAGVNAQENRKIQGERALALATLYRGIQNDARTEARQQQQDFRTNATAALASMSARREAYNTKLMSRIELLGKNGVTLEGLKNTSDPQLYNDMLVAAGGEEELKYTLFNAHSSKAVGTPTRIGDFMAQTYQLPDGTTKTEYVKLPADVLASDPELFKTINTDNGTFISIDGGKTWKPLAGSAKPGTGIPGVSTGGYVLGSNKTIDSYANQISLGGLKMSDVPKDLKPLVAQALDAITGGRLPPLINNLNESLALVKELKTHAGREAATGAPSLWTNPFGMSLPGSDARGFKGKVDRLNSLLFLNAIPQMRGMGQLTEREGAKLESSSSVTKNLGQSEEEYMKELNKLEQDLTTSIENLGGKESMGSQFAGGLNKTPEIVTAPDGTQIIITD